MRACLWDFDGDVLGSALFCGESAEERGIAILRVDEERGRGEAARALFARCGSRTSIGRGCVREHGDCGR
jgi:hypothetical protein